MTDNIVGKALWNDLARQVAVSTRAYDDAADLLHTAPLKLVHHRAQTPVDNFAAFLARKAINADIDARRHSRIFKTVSITQQLEESARFQDEVVGTRVRLIETKPGLDKLGECGRSSGITH